MKVVMDTNVIVSALLQQAHGQRRSLMLSRERT